MLSLAAKPGETVGMDVLLNITPYCACLTIISIEPS
jgi:hypothetical protein